MSFLSFSSLLVKAFHFPLHILISETIESISMLLSIKAICLAVYFFSMVKDDGRAVRGNAERQKTIAGQKPGQTELQKLVQAATEVDAMSVKLQAAQIEVDKKSEEVGIMLEEITSSTAKAEERLACLRCCRRRRVVRCRRDRRLFDVFAG